jgi:hypothetical protein
VHGAVAKPLGDGWAYSRSRSRSDVSPLIAASVALWVADLSSSWISWALLRSRSSSRLAESLDALASRAEERPWHQLIESLRLHHTA